MSSDLSCWRVASRAELRDSGHLRLSAKVIDVELMEKTAGNLLSWVTTSVDTRPTWTLSQWKGRQEPERKSEK